ncbi:D-3-phosphoglycerate dehydrogenase [hydrothermal vent metagenome]|uniref:D-3-phosphoglycerate dehydrogenase n=1 Tax=hydrothermal vent metagenome TaxID=652676 RepID=A0A3B0YJY3_9ZZZZ
MKLILLHPEIPQALKFQTSLKAQNTGFRVVISLDNVAPELVEVAIIWLTVQDYLQRLPNLKLLLICGSGVDHIINAKSLPRHISLVRLVDPYLRNHFSDYVVKTIVQHVLSKEEPLRSKCTSHWTGGNLVFPLPKVGLMGLGLVGEATAIKLVAMGFDVCGWVRTSRPRILPEVYVEKEALGDFAQQSEIIVCQLPLTKDTVGILNTRLFAQLPRGAYLVNVARGAHLNEADLLSALDTCQLSGACLDVINEEIPPANHRFGSHPKITLTPHIAGTLEPEQQAIYSAKIIACYYRGESLAGIVDYHACY